MSPFDRLLAQLLQQDPLGLGLGLVEQLLDKLPVGLRDGRWTGVVEQRDLVGGRRERGGRRGRERRLQDRGVDALRFAVA